MDEEIEDFFDLNRRLVANDQRKKQLKEKRSKRKIDAKRIVRVLNLGAGVQSTALILMDSLVYHQDKRSDVESWLGHTYQFPPLDCAIFADTQDEPGEVYEHLAKIKASDTALIIEVTQGRLGDDLIAGRNSSGQPFASIPAFTSQTEGVEGGITRRQCTSEYKIKVVERAIRQQVFGMKPGQTIPKDSAVVQVFGLSLDEPNRIARVRDRINSSSWSTPSFPLFDLGMERSDCVSFLKYFGWKSPRSACVFCPFKTNAEWRRLRDEDKKGWDRAVQVDNALRDPNSACNKNLVQKLYLHRSCVPLEIAPIDGPQSSGGFIFECEGMCGS